MNLVFRAGSLVAPGYNFPLASYNGVTSIAIMHYLMALKEGAKQAGWTVPSSSDGTTYNAAGDQITQVGSGAGGLNNLNAWFRLRSPAGLEYTFQVTNASTNVRIKVSDAAGFIGGTPGATQTPSATDEGIVLGSGTDASPSKVSFGTPATSMRGLFVFDLDPPYDFLAIAYATSTNGTTFFGKISLSKFKGADQSRHVTVHNGAGLSLVVAQLSALYVPLAGGQGLGAGWYKKGLTGAAFVGYRAGTWGAGGSVVVAPAGLGAHPYDGRLLRFPIPVERLAADTTQVGPKGQLDMRMMSWAASNHSSQSGSRNQLYTMDEGANRFLRVGDIYVPFPSGQEVIV